MPPHESPRFDPIEGALKEPPPSDLSEYTWDDSETARLEPGAAEARGESTSAASERLIGDDIGRFIDTLIQNRLVAEREIRALSARLFPDGQLGSVQPLAAELIRLGKLTPYQAAAIRQGKTKGLVIGGYIVLDKIGSGGMGLVLRARHRQSQRIVALKLLPPSVSRDRAAVIRFRREAAAVAKFRHPNIVSAIDSGETHGLLYLVMEFVRRLGPGQDRQGEGPALGRPDDRLRHPGGPRPPRSSRSWHRSSGHQARQSSARFLGNGQGSRPRPVRVNQTQELLAAGASESDLTVSGSIVGTVDYMSPEQAYDPRMADGRSDIYSLGCTLHYLLTGRSPFGGQTFMERLLGHRERPVPLLRASRRDVSEALDATFQHLLAKSPQDRPQTMAAVIGELQACRGSTGGKAPRPLMVLDDRPEKASDQESIYEIARPKRAKNQPPSEPLSTVFVRHRSASSNRLAKPRKTLARDRWRLFLGIVIVALGLIFGWWVLR